MVTCIWMSDDFAVIDKKTTPTSSEAVLKIDEGSEKITVFIPSELSLITKKIIERRVQSIAKSGFQLPNSGLRIGGGFTVEMTKSNEIPVVLLQEGHKYTYGEFLPPEKVREEPKQVKILPSRDEYIPSFLKHDQEEQIVSEIPKESIYEKETESADVVEITDVVTTLEEISPPKDVDYNEHMIAGSFIIALSEFGDIYLKKKDDIFSVEYTMGRIDFNIQDGDINILSTERIPVNDQTLQLALDKTRKNVL